ncbi:phosphatidate cytidylyltransferase [Roseivivax halodurans JCM 10272]|uniref:Phosphatidate cytidylyltransferase n=1 Tax=Roseivivax halodurans JCM 10272 TaxID=1449350 RepID=X7EL31_9RHOB|nr:UDP-2,3-diacylglucosamine diphosphatase LpxI [Roseivivax halodurans]ETX16632.1 phosphatidate cytidylyltransferase [Roseivivax halodurans JCM 10272]
MLALIAGRGRLPRAVAEAQPEPPLVCALDGHRPEGLTPDLTFRIERLGGLMETLRRRGISRICLCGGVDRPTIRPSAFDWRTLLLVPRIRRALTRGDDGALRSIIALFEERGFTVIAAHEAAPDLLPPAGAPTTVQPDARAEARLGDGVIAEMGRADLGQACVILGGGVIAREDDSGTDAMLRGLGPDARGGVLYKAPKPDQDRRADLPTIGPETASGAIRAGLRGIVIEAGGVIVLDRAEVIRRLDQAGLWLWVRKRTSE